ncbi:conserved hypothetical protein (plasmid) [Borreliella burgdorferi 29805]|nr:hypothetical protein [Borreliella burgdorferi]ACO38235.1 conserved hypothetical protein [Borreliella burgdorferi 29805]MCD2320551.1 hypothetical protein [Borreliella burgdorferi]MCD2413638.1 hypothetical protein [Borreliella burgdorferi]
MKISGIVVLGMITFSVISEIISPSQFYSLQEFCSQLYNIIKKLKK